MEQIVWRNTAPESVLCPHPSSSTVWCSGWWVQVRGEDDAIGWVLSCMHDNCPAAFKPQNKARMQEGLSELTEIAQETDTLK